MLKTVLPIFNNVVSKKMDSIRGNEDSLDSGLQSMLNTNNNFSIDTEKVEEEVNKLGETLGPA